MATLSRNVVREDTSWFVSGKRPRGSAFAVRLSVDPGKNSVGDIRLAQNFKAVVLNH